MHGDGREIVLDTETTGVDNKKNRVIEIGALEVINKMPTGNTYHVYLNPEQEVEAGALRVHGLTDEFLSDKSLFADEVDNFLAFMGDSPLVAHNAPFDVGFLNMELEKLGRAMMHNEVVDTLVIARKKFPGARASLDALCQRFEVDSTERVLHGALLDAELLAEVYLQLCGGLQHDLALSAETASGGKGVKLSQSQGEKREVRTFPVDAKELAAHNTFIAKTVKDALWSK